MADHKANLEARAQELQKEIQQMQQQFEVKKEEFLKIQGALEMLQVLNTEETPESSS
tara:strand:- start:1673 stop:1843 length:171 start_codon:yes stop_codon:yes gene_type:complete